MFFFSTCFIYVLQILRLSWNWMRLKFVATSLKAGYGKFTKFLQGTTFFSNQLPAFDLVVSFIESKC